MNDKKMFHEDTIIYSRSLELMETARELIGQFPRGFGFLADQLRRNTSSVSHNYAEGYYQRSKAQRRKYLEYASQSAREASASFDVARCFRVGKQETIVRGKRLCLELVKMIAGFGR